jgi:hypothetical protein
VADYSVYARGGNGALWSRTHTASGWGGWHSLGGRLLAGTGPAAFTQIEATIPENYVYELGSDDQIYENVVTWGAATPGLTGWHLAS